MSSSWFLGRAGRDGNGIVDVTSRSYWKPRSLVELTHASGKSLIVSNGIGCRLMSTGIGSALLKLENISCSLLCLTNRRASWLVIADSFNDTMEAVLFICKGEGAAGGSRHKEDRYQASRLFFFLLLWVRMKRTHKGIKATHVGRVIKLYLGNGIEDRERAMSSKHRYDNLTGRYGGLVDASRRNCLK